jgi:hypothetical protein
MSRRLFLKVCLALCLVVIIMLGVGYQYRRQIYRKYLQLRLDASANKGTLSPEQFQVIQAVFEVVAPKPAPSREALLAFVTWRTSDVDGYYREYTEAVDLIESRSRTHFSTSFVALALESKEKILHELLPRHTLLPLQETLPIGESEPPGLLQKLQVALQTVALRAEARFKYFVFWDLLRFYWTSGEGWAAVGYASYPGAPSHPRGYTVPPGTAPPYTD